MKIAVLGVAQTKFGELWDQSLPDLLVRSQLSAIRDAGIAVSEIDEIFTGTMCAGLFLNQSNIGVIAAEVLGLQVPSTVVEGACASGGLAVRAAIMAIESGQADIVLVSGVEKMTDVGSQQVADGLVSAASHEFEQIHGITFAALNALIARLYMHTYGLSRGQLAQVSVMNHDHGFTNSLGHFQKKITVDDVINAPMIADPLTLLDCSPISDGAASLVLCREDVARRLGNDHVFIIGSGQATDTMMLSEREDLLTWRATKLAAKKAYAMAGIDTDDVDLIELHDAFSITQLLALEDLGFYKKGFGIGSVSIDNDLIVNRSGGLKSRGHPVGATGVAQVVAVVQQLREGIGSVGLTHNVGGCGSTAVVHVLNREKL
ncbi:thiolase domain-containing protein [Candidatus Dependentiae bacterium]|nr:thiolase domain-containing protein [Candidatus Dependentiae bacterium]